MVYVVVKKATLLLPSGPGTDGQHLYAIITNPCDGDQCLLVSFSSVKQGRFHDPACLVNPGEHEFVVKPTYVEYRMARIMRCDHIDKCVSGWTFTPKGPISDDLLERIHNGVEQSDFTSGRVFNYFNANRHR